MPGKGILVESRASRLPDGDATEPARPFVTKISHGLLPYTTQTECTPEFVSDGEKILGV